MHHPLVTFSSQAGPAQGYVEKPGPDKPGVIVLQEWWGLVPHIKDVVGRLAAQGYVALAPDLYHGKSTVEAEEATHLMNGLDWGRARQEIAGAVAYLRDVEGCTRVGVVGFCMGGALTVIAAAHPGVDCYAAFYGFPGKGAVDLSTIKVPGRIFFGEEEGFFSVPDAQAFARAQEERGIDTEVIIYKGAGHAFFNNDRPQVYRESAAYDAWGRTLTLFGQNLRK